MATIPPSLTERMRGMYSLLNRYDFRCGQEEAPHSQVINNACATQAILNIVMNLAGKVDLGPTISEFKAFTNDFDAEMKGLAISNSETIRAVHNSFARAESFLDSSKPRKATKDDDLFHFTTFLPVNGHLYELDGLKPFPVNFGAWRIPVMLSNIIP